MSKPIYLYITPFFPSEESWRGGFCLDAVKAIMHDGRYDVRVIVTGDGCDYEWSGIKIYRLRSYIAPCGLAPFIFDGLNNKRLMQKLNATNVRVEDIAVCHVNSLSLGHYAAYIKRLNPNAKTVIQLHSSYSLHLDSGRLGVIPIHATLLYFYYRRICASVDILAFVSDMSRRTFGKRYVGTPEGEVREIRSLLLLGKILPLLKLPKQTVVYNGIDTSLFYPNPKPPHEGFIIGCVANFQPLKDHMTLLKAVNILKGKIDGLEVRLVGSGVTLDACKAYVEQNGLSDIVLFEKEVDHRDLPDFYRSLDLFVMPSRLEGFLCVATECWACGTPAVFCKNIGLSELITDEERGKWLFNPRDEHDLASKILAYKDGKWQQHFTVDLEINGIWQRFLDEVNING